MPKSDKQILLEYWKDVQVKLRAAYVALIDGGVKSYMINDRQLTRFDLDTLRREMDEADRKVAELSAEADGKAPRKSVGVIPRDW